MRILLGLFCFLSFTSASAAPLYLEFERLEGVRIGDQVEVRYQLTPASWQALEQGRMRPQLLAELLGPDRRARVARTPIEQAAGQFRIAFAEKLQPRAVRFALQHPGVAGFRQAGVGVVTLSRALINGTARDSLVVVPARGVSPNHALEACNRYGDEAENCRAAVRARPEMGAALVAACADQGRNRLSCLNNSAAAPTDMASAVRACASLVTGVDERQRCVQSAAAAKRDPAGLVRACGRGFETTAARLSCVARGAGTRGDGAGAVEQCAFAFEGPIARLDCLALAEAAPVDLAAMVAACRQALPWANPRRRCVEAAASAKVDISSAIIACRSGARSPAAVLQCAQHAARTRNAALATSIHGCSGAADDSDFNHCVAQAVESN